MREIGGKVAVVTGAASGIGLAIATRLAEAGARVALADRDEQALLPATETVVEAGAAPGGVSSHRVDVTDEADVAGLADQVFGEWGQVDILVNNAGVFTGGLMWERPAADMEFVLGVNLWGILHGVHAFVPRMIAQNTEGHVVNTCSVAGLLTSPLAGPYVISKFAALAATESLAHDLAATGSPIKVSALCPGMVDTGLSKSSQLNRPESLATESTPDAELADQALAAFLAQGIPPSEVADQVVDAIRTERFLVLTHDHQRPAVEARLAQLLEGRLPDPSDYR